MVACKKYFKCFKHTSHSTGTTHLTRHIEQCLNAKATLTVSDSSVSTNCIDNYCKRKIPSSAKADVLKSVVNLVVQDLRPLSVVDGAGIKSFVQKLIDVGSKYGKLDAN